MESNKDIQNEEILNFFKREFNIDLKSYNAEKRRIIIEAINSEIDKKIEEEQSRYINLSSELEKQKGILESVIKYNIQ